MPNFQQPSDPPLLEWSAPQDVHYERGTLWYIMATLFVAGCIAYSIWTQAWTFLVVIVLVAATYWKTHRRAPEQKRMRIWSQGFAIDNTFYAWAETEGFWILKGPDYFELHIEKKSGGSIKIQTGAIDGYLLQDVMGNLAAELENRKEKLLDTIIRICKL